MEKTVGRTDSYIRILIGALSGLTSIGILMDALPLQQVYAPVFGLIAIVLLVTAYTGYCPAYSLLDVETKE